MVEHLEEESSEFTRLLADWIRGQVFDSMFGASPPGWIVDEYPLTPTQGGLSLTPANGTVQLTAQYSGIERITSIIAVVAAPATAGLLQLGARLFPLPVGVTNLTGIQVELTTDDVRQLTITGGPAAAYLELMGYNVPGTGTGVARDTR